MPADSSGPGASSTGNWYAGPSSAHLERGRQAEDHLAVLDGQHPPGGERAAVPDRFDRVQDRRAGVARPQEVGVQRVHPAVVRHRPSGRHQGLPGHQAAERPGGPGVEGEPAVGPDLDLLQVEELLERYRFLAYDSASPLASPSARC